MSAKKQAQSPWYECGKCGQKFLRLFVTKHNDLNCGTVFPLIENGVLVSTVSKVPANSKINQLPFITTPMGVSTIFLSDAIIQECKLETFSWVLVKSLPKNDDSFDGIVDEVIPNAMQVWPIPDQQISQNTPHVIITTDALIANCISTLGSPVSVGKLNNTGFDGAEVVGITILNGVEVNAGFFCDSAKRKLRYRIIATGNCFQIRYYADLVKFQISNVNGNGMSNEPTDSLAQKLESLSCSGGDVKSEVLEYFEINNETKFYLEKESKNDDTQETIPITIEDIGGMDSCIQELTSFIKYVFTPSANISHGILIHGQIGTGKTLLWQAICNSLKMHPVVLRDIEITPELEHMFSPKHSAVNLEDALNKATLNQPAAIIIENIEVRSPASSSIRSNQMSSFSWALRSFISSLKNTKVLVIATAVNIDALDSVLRSANSFEKEIETPIPSVIQREDICFKILRGMNHSLKPDEIKALAASTHGYVGADLRGLFTQAAINLAREQLAQNTTNEEVTLYSTPFTVKYVQEAMKTVRPSAMKSILVDVPNVKWDDIGGQKELKFKLKQAIEWPLKHPEAFQRFGITPPKGILMYGPPGCSKTMIAKAIATESGLNFINVKSSELFSKWVGESEKAVQKIFRKAKQVAPCVVFFDEIDSLGGERGASSGGSNVHERVLAQLLVEIDGVEPLREVTIVAATNRPDIIDQALLRPGRLDRIIYVPLPDPEAREEILKIWFKRMPVHSSVEIAPLVQLTEGYSGAELTAVCHEAALCALEENIEAKTIYDSHFASALKTVKPRISKEQIQFYDRYHANLKPNNK